MTTAADAHDQQLVLYYGISMFTSFLAGLLATARRARERRHKSLVTNLIRAIVVAFTLLVDLGRAKLRGPQILGSDRVRSAAPTLVTVS